MMSCWPTVINDMDDGGVDMIVFLMRIPCRLVHGVRVLALFNMSRMPA
jgi:hypothetical protein